MTNVEIFNIVEDKDKSLRITCGNYLVSDKKFKSEKAAIAYVKSKPYEIIFNTFSAMLEMQKQHENKETKSETPKDEENRENN